MTPDETTPPPPTPKPKRKSPGELEKRLLDDIDTAADCHREAAEVDVTVALAPRGWTTDDQDALGASLVKCGQLKNRIKAARTGRQTRTDEEEAAHAALIIALNPVVVAARGKYPKGSAARKSYGHGVNLPASSTRKLLDLAAYAFEQLKSQGGTTSPPPKDVLPGLLATEIAALGTLHGQYKDADWAQAEAQEDAESLLGQLETEVSTVLNVSRRKCQTKAELAYPHTTGGNGAIRKRFGLPPDRRMTD